MRPQQRPRRLAATLAAFALLSAACGWDADPDAADGGSFTVIAHQGEDVLGGSEISFDSLLGQGRPVVLNYWAAQCPPCRIEMPWLQTAYEQHADSVLLVGIDVGQFTGLGTTEQGAELLADLDISYPAGYAVDEQPMRQFDVTNMPFTVFFDETGEVVDNHAGIMSQQQIQDRFATLAAGAE